MIELHGLTKRYGDTVAVDDLTLTVEPGRVTGFLGPNGAGKSTTMRLILGLDRPTSGEALIGGRPFRDITEPLRHVGALLSADDVHPGRTARAHLRVAALTSGISVARVEDVLGLVGLTSVAGRRIGTFSLGMRQRLGVAAALLGDPGVVLFDEPVNGLDLEGIRWIRTLVRDLAEEGRTVLLSSHQLSEMQRTADHLIVIGGGRLIADAPTAEVVAATAALTVHVRTPDAAVLATCLRASGVAVEPGAEGELLATGATPAAIGDIAAANGVPIHGLREQETSLEDAYLRLTTGSVEFTAATHHPEVSR